MSGYRNPFFYCLFAAGILSSTAMAQSPVVKKKPFQDTLLFADGLNWNSAGENMRIFRKEQPLQAYGGWKWYARALDEYGKNTGKNGELPSAREYYRNLVQAQKPALTARAAGDWYPAGPSVRPNTGPYLQNYGMVRINCIAFHPTQKNTWYVGAAQGGIWKTTDSGSTWTEQNNGLPILRISDIAIDPNNPDVLYACIGDFEYCEISLVSADRKRNTHYGMGIFKSVNGGSSWSPTGLSAAQTDFDGSLFRRVFVNPANSNELVAAGISGIYKSYNAGSNWSRVSNEVISDLEMTVKNNKVLYAAGRWLEFSDSGEALILKSYDFGKTWKKITVPWPEKNAVTRIELALAPSDTNYVYAVCAGQNGGDFYGFFRSTDAGKNWVNMYSGTENLLSENPASGGTYSQGKYDLAIEVKPDAKDIVVLGGIQSLITDDGGSTWYMICGDILHVDQHQFRYHPQINMLFFCNDGGLYTISGDVMSTNFADYNNSVFNVNACNFRLKNVNLGSFYRLGVNRDNDTVLISGQQDNGTVIGNSRVWTFVSGGDGMDCDYWKDGGTGTETVISSSQYGYFYAFVDKAYDGSFFNSNSYAGNGEWTTPMLADIRYDTSWKSHYFYNLYLLYDQLIDFNNGWSAEVTNFNTRPGTAMAATSFDTGYLYVAKKPDLRVGLNKPAEIYRIKFPLSSSAWTNVSGNLPDSLYVTDMAGFSGNQRMMAVSFGGFSAGNKVFRTLDAGTTWKNITYNLPNLPVNALVYDTSDWRHTLYCGMDVGVYYINDSMNQWKLYSKNLPNVIVSDLKIRYATHEIFAATFGRAIWACPLPQVPAKPGTGTNAVSKIVKVPEIQIENPVHQRLNIRIQGGNMKEYPADIIGLNGQVVYQCRLQNGTNQLELPAVCHGTFFLRIFERDRVVRAEKLIIGLE